MSVTLTDLAVTKIKEMQSQDKNLAGKNLRVYLETGGCNGYSYAFKFDDAKEGDFKQAYDGFSLLVDPESDKIMNGSVIDYKEDFGQEGFAIKNPNAKKSCGCGNSFDA